jgi:cupin 2 domain-containing protein
MTLSSDRPDPRSATQPTQPHSPAPRDNLWALPDPLPTTEWFETLLQTALVRVERIVSTGQVTPPGEWYDQEADEWVVLLQGQATLEYADGRQQALTAGDYVFLPAHCRHRVAYTSHQPPCIWLAIHGCLSGSATGLSKPCQTAAP